MFDYFYYAFIQFGFSYNVDNINSIDEYIRLDLEDKYDYSDYGEY